MLLIKNSATDENAWISTGGEPIQSGGLTREDDDVDRESYTKFMESFYNQSVKPDRYGRLTEARKEKKNWRKLLKRHLRAQKTLSRTKMKCMESFIEISKSLIDSRKGSTPVTKLLKSMKATIDIPKGGCQSVSRHFHKETMIFSNIVNLLRCWNMSWGVTTGKRSMRCHYKKMDTPTKIHRWKG